MPTYEYRCTECGEDLEVVQSIRDESLTECPTCGGRLRKVFSPIGIAFKGSGFYKTDSRSSGRAGSGSGNGHKDDKGGSGGDGGSTDSSSSSSSSSKDSSSTSSSGSSDSGTKTGSSAS